MITCRTDRQTDTQTDGAWRRSKPKQKKLSTMRRRNKKKMPTKAVVRKFFVFATTSLALQNKNKGRDGGQNKVLYPTRKWTIILASPIKTELKRTGRIISALKPPALKLGQTRKPMQKLDRHTFTIYRSLRHLSSRCPCLSNTLPSTTPSSRCSPSRTSYMGLPCAHR